ncbi:methyltransferase domain-containing protein [Haloarchaeobius amylolyticus]|uniref:methyltransferase domain-containing protein n=1 Tax=Haloarchaeobius amylolyticus TaxID=1198296 RepID=UPI00226EC269|nr:methyltransferase domain-containing protein [Haloarchaeobius amylolyticus]
MGGTLEYDEAEARREEAIYRTPAAAARRKRVRDLLALDPGERVCAIGCGPGFEPLELGRAVGATGQVLGIDRSDAMLSLAARRCDGQPQVTLSKADARSLPVPDGAVDAATAVQVYEYLDDPADALAELARVLRPGGRAVVCDTDFDSLVWRSADDERMARVLDAFDDHCPRPRLGSALAPYLRDAGFRIERVEPNTMLNTRLDPGRFAYHLMAFIEDYAADHEAIGPDEAAAWVADLREQDEAGGTFFTVTQYCYLVRKAAR